MKKAVYYLLATLFISGFTWDAAAQMNRKNIKKNNKRIASYRGRKSNFGKDKVYNMLGVSLNSLNYFGDLSPTPKRISTDLSLTRPAIGLSFTHRFGPRYQLQAAFTYGGIRGSDTESADQSDTQNGIFRYNRNLSFRNRIKELSVVAQIDLWENMSTYISRVQWTPYLYAGISVFHHNPQAKAPDTDAAGNPTGKGGQWVDLQPLGTEGQFASLQPGDANYGIKPYKRIQPAIPIGIGARFRINEVMDIAAEFGFRYTFTDYLDDVSRNYVDLGVFGNNHLARAMSYRSNEVATPTYTYTGRDGVTYTVLPGYGAENIENVRGNKSNRDIFMVTTVRLTYILGKTFHRAKFR
ncbi:MAG: DUF6089 family protein [Cyclobacteriaceae bacterium]|nr:DUF6089 family protein [Cyclobacteriaceae bacterium]MDW8330822.1 DUF6089 family protein [Cyclobacteriaceae bacterium]